MAQTQQAQVWLDAAASKVRRRLRLALAAAITGTVLLCLQAALLAWALQQAIFEQAGVQELVPALADYLLLAGLRFLLAVRGRRASFEAGQEVVATTRKRILDHMRRLGPVWLTHQSGGARITQVVDGIDALAPYYARYLPQKAASALLPLVIVATVFPFDWVSATVMLVSAPLVPLFMVLLGDAAERASQRRWLSLTRLGEQFFDSLRGLVTLRLFGTGQVRRKHLARASDAYRRETMAVLRMAFLSSLVLEFFATVSIAVVAVLVGFRLLWGDLDFFRGMYALLLAPEFFLPLRALGALRHARMDALSVATDLDSLLSQAPGPSVQAAGPRSESCMTHAAVALDLKAVRYRHEADRGGVLDFSLSVPAGAHVVLVGASGSGKSTLLQLLLGFLAPQAGSIRVDGADLSTLDPAAWRRRLAWVPQRPHLFAGTLRDNVLMACPQADDAQLERVAAQVGLDSVLQALPAGWDTRLGEYGHGLSGGQAQRVALARALLRDASLVLLDEPTQQLDAGSAATIQRGLTTLRRDRTVIEAAHRLASALQADLVVVMERGRIVESGTPEVLMHAGGAFQHLLEAEAAA